MACARGCLGRIGSCMGSCFGSCAGCMGSCVGCMGSSCGKCVNGTKYLCFDPNGPQLARKIKRLAKSASGMFAAVLKEIGPSLPEPGPIIAKALEIFFGWAEKAIVDQPNVVELGERVEAYASMLANNPAMLEDPDNKEAAAEFAELLQRSKAYLRQSVGGNALTDVLTSSGAERQAAFEKLIKDFGAILDKTSAGYSPSVNARLSALKRKGQPAYMDPSMGARALVDTLGGMDDVRHNPAKLLQVLDHMNLGDTVKAELVRSLLAAHLESGPHQLINQPDLRLFWKDAWGAASDVSWRDWWGVFPDGLIAVHSDTGIVSELQRLLSTYESRMAFQLAVDQGVPDERVGAWELGKAFNGYENLDSQVKQLLNEARGAAAQQGVVRCQLPKLPDQPLGREDEKAKLLDMLTRGAPVAWEGKEATVHAAVLVGEGGNGKSSLAAEVGWQLVRGGKVPGGALWVDLRAAATALAVRTRMCRALGVVPDGPDAIDGIATEITVLAAGADPTKAGAAGIATKGAKPAAPSTGVNKPGGALLVLDNVEDVLMSEEAARCLGGVLAKLLVGAPGLRLVVTTRPVGQFDRAALPSPMSTGERELVQLLRLLPEFRVAAVSFDRGIPILMEALSAPKPTKPTEKGPAKKEPAEKAKRDPEKVAQLRLLCLATAKNLAEACGGLPILVELVSDGIAKGRLLVQEVMLAGPGLLRKAVSKFTEEQRRDIALLSVFPSAFSVEDASRVLSRSEFETRGTLSMLHSMGVLSHAPRMRYEMSALVQELRIEPAQQQQAESRFVTHMLRKLTDCADRYHSVRWQTGLSRVRDQGHNIERLLQLLRAGASRTEGAAWSNGWVLEFHTTHLVALLGAIGMADAWTATMGAVAEPLGAAGASLLHAQAITAAGPRPGGSGAGQHLQACGGAGAVQAQQQRLSGVDDGRAASAPKPEAAAGAMKAWVELLAGTDEGGEAAKEKQQRWEACCARFSPLHLNTLDAQSKIAEVALHAAHDCSSRAAAGAGDDAAAAGSRAADLRAFASALLEAIMERRHDLEVESSSSVEGEDLEIASPMLLLGQSKLVESVDASQHAAPGKAGLLREAEAWLRRALRVRRRWLGNEHPYTITAWEELAKCLLAQGAFAVLWEVEGAYRWALASRQRLYGPRHPLTKKIEQQLAACAAARRAPAGGGGGPQGPASPERPAAGPGAAVTLEIAASAAAAGGESEEAA